MVHSRTRVILDLELAADPIRGQLQDEAGHSQPFTGWLELASALEDTRATAVVAVPPGGEESPEPREAPKADPLKEVDS
jgi:hypothetical protein